MSIKKFRRQVGSRPCVEGHTVLVTDRGGSVRQLEIRDMSQVRWSRLMDQRSSATITVTGAACSRQSEALERVEPRRNEIVIYRGDDRVWEGPIRAIKKKRDSITINAFDIGEYLAGRALTKYWPGPQNGGPTLMTDRVEEILEYELTTSYTAPGTAQIVPAWELIDPPIDVIPFLEVRTGAILTRAETIPFEMSVLEHLQNLARGGLDFTVIGRKLLVWDSAMPIGRTRMMTEADLQGDPTIYHSGEDLVAVQHVIGQPAEGAPLTSTKNVGSYLRDLSYYGPWMKLHSRSDEEGSDTASQETLNTQARNLSANGVPVPIDLEIGSGATLRLDHTLGINDLIPGVEIPMTATLFGGRIQQTQRLNSLSVDENADGENISGTIGQPSAEDDD